MALSNELITQFAKLAVKKDPPKKESSTYGTIVEYDGAKYVRLDGSDLLTPIPATTTNAENDERVTVKIENHMVTVTGNVSSPAPRSEEIEEIGKTITQFETILADKVDTVELNAQVARIDQLQSDNVTIKNTLEATNVNVKNLQASNVTISDKLTAAEADIDELEAVNVTITGRLDAADASIGTLQTDNVTIKQTLTATDASIKNLQASNATISGELTAAKGDIAELETNKLSATDADLRYANIDFTNIGTAAMEYFYANSGLIKDVTVENGTITGNLVGVTISGDLIEGNTIKAEKLVVKGSDGLYYKLNTDGMTVEAEQTDQNSLNGSVILAKSITATKIKVDDLVAFDATIGGFNITDKTIHSGAKTTIDNTTEGVYLDSDGQANIGDGNNFLKFYKDEEDIYRLIVSAQSIQLGSYNKDIESIIDETKNTSDVNTAAINEARVEIDGIHATIQNLITGENGETLMTQTDTGWTFNISALQNALNAATSDISDIQEGLESASSLIENLNQDVADLGVYTDYIKFGVDNGKPCIILGETDSVFKVVITNTDIRFMEGSAVPASISNQSLNIEKAVISEELQQGGFAWAARSNGNYGLVWKGVG